MNLKTRIIATLLAVLTLLGSSVIAVSAADADEKTDQKIARKYLLAENVYNTPEEKLASMEKMLENESYVLYMDSVSGEIALHQKGTKNILFSNPYDVASSKGSWMETQGANNKPGTKEKKLMSQVIINFQDSTGATQALSSFADSAMREQIRISKIKGGVRVEYTIGQEEFRKLVPKQIPKESFEELLCKPLLEAIENGAYGGVEPGKKAEDNPKYQKFFYAYSLKDPKKAMSSSELSTLYKDYPYLKEAEGNALYVLGTDVLNSDIALIEDMIKTYCADTYSFEQMDIDHELTGYEADNEEYPVFKLALEYTLDETGLSVRVPCSGLQYNSESYTLESISILPYMGAGNTKNDGYNFFPDGSGSLFDFNLNKEETILGKIYGTDYAYHQISGKYQKSIRVPVYGTVAEEVIYSYEYYEVGSTEPIKVRVSNTVKTLDQIKEELSSDEVLNGDDVKITTETYNRGYVAVIEEGESLGEITSYFAGNQSDYATMSNYFNPKPKDAYDISDSLSVGSSEEIPVVSERRYTGGIQIHYQMLGESTYEPSWLGMAEAYRDYLVKKGTIQRLTAEDVEADIPLYMEVFGTLETQQTIATLPVNVMTPLTTFEDILSMYESLSSAGAKNVNFKMTGFANGGMYSTVPSSIKWEKSVGGKSGFYDLIAQANAINAADDTRHIGLYPDFDFAYAGENSLFDSLNLKRDGIRTIDNRYTSKRQYSATQQKYVSYFQLAISPSRYNKFYEKLMDVYSKYGINTMSVASLGTALNSDFDEEDPYHREDSKKFTVTAFENLSENYSLMSEGGNAYSWSYVDHLLNFDLDSSRFVKACASVPFLGVVLHGYVQFAGSPFNEEGDTDYALLKAIENGAGMYFILSYQNTAELKEDEVLSQYYSIDFQIWKNDVAAYYNVLNGALKDVQTSLIIDHEFLNYNNRGKDGKQFLTERVLDIDELDKEILEELNKAEADAKEKEELEAINKVASVADARVALSSSIATLAGILSQVDSLNASLEDAIAKNHDVVSALIAKPDDEKALNDYRDSMKNICYTYTYLEDQFALAAEKLASLKEEDLAFLKDELGETSELYLMAVDQWNQANEYLNGGADFPGRRNAQMSVYETLIANWSEVVNGVTDFETAFNMINDNVIAQTKVTGLDDLYEKSAYQRPVTQDDQTKVETEVESSRYHVNNNNVVAVTYGDIVDGVKQAQKTFILNYNNYAICVTYNGFVYTVEAGGYVIVPTAQA